MLIGKITDGNYLDLNENHFTTHSLCVGMTGSGKTGFSISILEKLALLKIPTLILDPKGDLGNLFLIFPELNADEFALYTDEPEKISKIWKENLEKEGIGKDELLKLKDSVERRIITPGLSSCSPLNILPSFLAPLPFEMENEIEDVRERIRNIISGIFKLIGKEPDPFSDTSFIFLSMCVEYFFKSGKKLSIDDLILSLESPPFSKIGVMPLEKAFPLKERRELAFKLNNLIASPQFSAWFGGFPLNFNDLFYTREGKPCHTIIYLNHLEDNLKQFAVTIILNELYNFVRKQKGSDELKYLLYFDEISGFLPPSPSNPPSKQPILNLLKKARAFGLGVYLATQNPIDLDYRALSNIGIYAIGRLHTQQDKDRIKDFIGRDEKAMEKISNLNPREFWIKDVKDPKTPCVIKSLQVCCYLKGPMTIEEIKKFAHPFEEAKNQTEKKSFFIPSNISVFYEKKNTELFPFFLVQTNLFYSKESAKLNVVKDVFFVSEIKKGNYEWRKLKEKPDLDLNPPLSEKINFSIELDLEKEIKDAEKNIKARISTLNPLKIYYNPFLKLFSTFEEEKEEFIKKCEENTLYLIKAKLEEKRKIYQLKLERIREQIEKERYYLKRDEEEVSLKSAERNINLLEAGLSVLFGGKKTFAKIKSTISKAGQVGRKEKQLRKEKMDVLQRKEKIQRLEEELIFIENEMKKELSLIENEEREKASKIEEIIVYPLESKSTIEKISLVFLDKNSLNL